MNNIVKIEDYSTPVKPGDIIIWEYKVSPWLWLRAYQRDQIEKMILASTGFEYVGLEEIEDRPDGYYIHIKIRVTKDSFTFKDNVQVQQAGVPIGTIIAIISAALGFSLVVTLTGVFIIKPVADVAKTPAGQVALGSFSITLVAAIIITLYTLLSKGKNANRSQ